LYQNFLQMQFLVFVIIYPILWIISILPFRLFYLFSDFVYFLVYYVIGYRKKTVRKNLAMALPHLTEKERLVIEKKFFQHMCDMFLEMIKTISISEKEMEKRFQFKNLEVYKQLEAEGKSIALIASHYASYEWVVSMNKYISFKGIGIYKKIANPHFDKLVHKIRSKFKAQLVTTKETKATIVRNHRENILCVYGFASDQTPRLSKRNYWSNFMGIVTPVHIGAEALAKEFDMNVIFLKVKKLKRGHYEASFEVLANGNTQSIPDYEITETYLRKVEQQILETPEYYLWTHKRWKHRR
jgi:KDO2-lipid IV(A) lauroyltransferase